MSQTNGLLWSLRCVSFLLSLPIRSIYVERCCTHTDFCSCHDASLHAQAEKVLLEELNAGKSNKEYLPVTGLQAFLDVTSQVS